MQQMIETPIQIGDVQVMGINRSTREMHLNIHIDCKADEIVLLSSKVEASEKLKRAFKYLVDEGYIISSPIHRWDIRVSAQSKF
jgi:hypothetical protein